VDPSCDIQVSIYAPEVPDFHNNVLSIPNVPMRPFCFAFSEPASDTRILFVRQRKKKCEEQREEFWCGAELSLEKKKVVHEMRENLAINDKTCARKREENKKRRSMVQKPSVHTV
jgi:hypothetical protein